MYMGVYHHIHNMKVLCRVIMDFKSIGPGGQEFFQGLISSNKLIATKDATVSTKRKLMAFRIVRSKLKVLVVVKKCGRSFKD